MSTCTSSSSCSRRIMSGEAHGIGATLARGALRLLSIPYGAGAALAEIVKSGQGGVDVGIPVLSVGNITCGGTGKTPLVAMVVRELLERGRRPVILSRGYRALEDGANDEARVLARLLPDVLHLQDKDRVALARRTADARLGDVIVLDDGFQYQALHRTLNVCAIDASNPFGYGAILPRGLLREPLSGLYRARPVVITRAELATAAEIATIRAEILRHNEHANILVSRMRPVSLCDVQGTRVGEPSSLGGESVALACGIGNPESFARGVRALGARVVHRDERGDHHRWSAADAAGLAKAAGARSASVVLTTAKDAVKLGEHPWPEGAPPLRVLEVEAEIVEGDRAAWKSLVDEALKHR